MKVKLRRLGILDAGKLLAVIYGLFSLLLLPLLSLALIITHKEGAGRTMIMLLIYPILGFITGVIGAVIFNLAAKITGGIEMTFYEYEKKRSQQAGAGYPPQGVGSPDP